MRFTLRELRVLASDRNKYGLSANEQKGIRKYLKSKEAKKRMARGKAHKGRRFNPFATTNLDPGF